MSTSETTCTATCFVYYKSFIKTIQNFFSLKISRISTKDKSDGNYVLMSTEETPVDDKVLKTLLVIVMDQSSSMRRKKAETLDGFNEFISQQKLAAAGDQTLVYLLTFNSQTTVVHKGMPLDEFPLLTDKDFRPSRGTALHDAVAEGIELGRETKQAGDRVICMIVTDGEENSSKTSVYQMCQMMSECVATGEWTFAYIGQNPDYWSVTTGTSLSNTSPYNHTNSRQNYTTMSAGLSRLRTSREMSSHTMFLHIV